MSYFQRILVNTLTFISLAVLFPAMVHVSSIWTAVLASFVLSVLNMFVKPILTILSLPFTLVTLGLFTFVINAAILKMTSFLWEQNILVFFIRCSVVSSYLDVACQCNCQ